ncbi:MAG: helix-turn-helix domain-containing protein [Clostridium sp.]|nr:helix-turn-helix domain-containing protein [Clostridium sp.]MCM1546806.1 helix-turn-helix domain-containing protein [Ruminococcus sp.]
MAFNAAQLFNLSEYECEGLANKAGLSLLYDKNISLAVFLKDRTIKTGELIRCASISERMLQYYMKGKKPTKQALLAIAISLDLPIDEIIILLRKYGYCISESLPNDAVALWYLKNYYTQINGVTTLDSINEVLEKLELPLLMTKLINR